MDDLRERLLAPARDGEPPAGLAERIHRDVAGRSRRRRAAALAAGAAVAVAAVVLTADLAPRRGAAPSPPPAGRTQPATGRAGPPTPLHQGLVPGPAPRTTTLAALFPGREPVAVPRGLPGGRAFRAFELTPAGTLIGVDQRYDATGMDDWTGSLLLDPRHGVRTGLPAAELALFRSDGRFLGRLAHTDPQDKMNLLCRDLRGGGDRQLSAGSVWESSVVADGGRFAWTYYEGRDRADGEVAIAAACAGPERVLPVRGSTVALHGRYLFVVAGSGALLRLDLETATTQPVPLGGAAREVPLVAVGPDTVLWSPADADGYPTALRARGLSTGRDVLVAARAPRAERGINGVGTRLTAGNRLLAYASSPVDGPPGDSRGLVYDPLTNAVVTFPGEVFAAGNWLVWLEGDQYRLLDVS